MWPSAVGRKLFFFRGAEAAVVLSTYGGLLNTYVKEHLRPEVKIRYSSCVKNK